MAIQPTQPQGIGGVVDTAFQLYKASLGAVWPLCLLLSLVSSPPNVYLIVKGGGAVPSGDIQSAQAMFGLMTDPMYLVVYFVSLALLMWVIGAIYLKQNAIGVDADITLGAALQASSRRIVALLLMVVLFFIALLAGLMLLVIPGLILMVSMILATNLVVLERKGPIEALLGSHRLVWGNWWRSATVLTVGSILVAIFYLMVGFVIGLLTTLIGVVDLVTYSLVTGLLIGLLVNIVVMPFFSALLLALYWDLKLRKEGGDLAARVGALNVA